MDRTLEIRRNATGWEGRDTDAGARRESVALFGTEWLPLAVTPAASFDVARGSVLAAGYYGAVTAYQEPGATSERFAVLAERVAAYRVAAAARRDAMRAVVAVTDGDAEAEWEAYTVAQERANVAYRQAMAQPWAGGK